MAINAFEISTLGQKYVPLNLANAIREGNNSDIVSRRGRFKKKVSPYLHNEKIQMTSRITAKRFVQKNENMFTSFPFTAKIYKANSDEFKTKKGKPKQKNKKSVLTLPNGGPFQACTVSDMNGSDYYKHQNNQKLKEKKRAGIQNRQFFPKTKGFEIIDRDAHYGLDDSITDFLSKKHGDDRLSRKDMCSESVDFGAQDVWTVLRNINKFQFRPTVKFSDDSLLSSKKKKMITKRTKSMGKGRRLIETCRTQEISYVANIEIEHASKTTISQGSSFDRVTVINKDKNSSALEKTKKQLTRTHSKNKNLNQGEKIINKYSMKICPKPTQMRDPKQWNNSQRDNRNNALNVGRRPQESFSTINESQDSSNCFRKENETPSVCRLRQKPFSHPNDNKGIISKLPRSNLFNNENKNIPREKPRALIKFNNNLNTNSTANMQIPKPRLVTTMPSSSILPNFTTIEIKKKLSTLRFPITVLGRDQISSTIEVFDYDIYDQFDGLDKQIWPYMVEWDPKYTPKSRHITPIERITNHLRKINDDLSLVKARERKGPYGEMIVMPKKKTEKRANQGLESTLTSEVNKKTRPMRQFKDKMLKLLYKKSSPSKLFNSGSEQEHKDEQISKVDASTDMPNELDKNVFITNSSKKIPDVQAMLRRYPKPVGQLEYQLPQLKHTVTKGKWTSDFIDNIMKKIKNGAYYITDEQKKLGPPVTNNVVQKVCQHNTVNVKEKNIQAHGDYELKDMSIQTALLNNVEQKVPELNVVNSYATEWNINDPMLKIPGFDDPIPNLEISSIGVNQIAVKNIEANVTVHFDVSIPSSQQSSATVLSYQKSSSSCCIPLLAKSSQSKIYKCSTTLLNAMLPAELCTVLPIIMRNVIDSTTTLSTSLTDSCITISELHDSVCTNSYKPEIEQSKVYDSLLGPYNQVTCRQKVRIPTKEIARKLNFCIPTLPTLYPWLEYLPQFKKLSKELLAMLRGHFTTNSVKLRSWKRFCNYPKVFTKFEALKRIKIDFSENKRLPKPVVQGLMYIVVDPRQFLISDPKVESSFRESTNFVPAEINKNISVIPYKQKESSWVSFIDLGRLLQKMWDYCKFNIHFNLPQFVNVAHIKRPKNTFTLEVKVKQVHTVEKFSVTITNLPINLYNDSSEKGLVPRNSRIKNCIDQLNNCICCDKSNEERLESQDIKPEKVKFRKSNYSKLYKRCKSTSNVGDRICTPLSKIESLDDFMQAMGSSKTLASVFNEVTAQKVLACVGEMKNWIKEITPYQALLILLLLNKKDTPILVRFRPVLLQGIAVCRITRANELDMEIEVIEKENIRVNQYDGISYISSSEMNKNNLFEELCWIAKTTASDYQKQFDENQEKLLKSLLQKRKQLNPSYLRVMARYVGLGLLKTPAKH